MLRLGIFLLTLALIGCDPKTPSTDKKTLDSKPAPVSLSAAEANTARQMLFDRGKEALAATSSAASELKRAAVEFLSSPNQETHSQTHEAWLNCAMRYRSFNAAAHIALAAPERFETFNRLDYQIAGFPIQPGFLDAFGPYAYSGLVFDVGQTLSRESLIKQHGLTDLSEVVLGLYAIEFMLFGVDGKRNIADFTPVEKLDEALKEKGFNSVEEIPQNRRRTLLSLQVNALSDDIQALEFLWNNRTAEGIPTQWGKLSLAKQQRIAHDAAMSLITQVMLELGELNRGTQGDSDISNFIQRAELAVQWRYVEGAIASLKTLAGFLPEEQRQAIGIVLEETLTAQPPAQSDEEEARQVFWRELFSLMKRASVVLTDDT